MAGNEIIVRDFDGQPIHCRVHESMLWISTQDIGEALGYEQPARSVNNLYTAHSDEFDSDCTRIHQIGVPGQSGFARIREFSIEGVMLLCMFSEQPKAKPFRKWARKVLAEVATIGSYSLRTGAWRYSPPSGIRVHWTEMLSPSEMLRFAELQVKVWMALADKPRSRALWNAFYALYGGPKGYAEYLTQKGLPAPKSREDWHAFERDMERPWFTPEESWGDDEPDEDPQ